jgi:hypothetical protein
MMTSWISPPPASLSLLQRVLNISFGETTSPSVAWNITPVQTNKQESIRWWRFGSMVLVQFRMMYPSNTVSISSFSIPIVSHGLPNPMAVPNAQNGDLLYAGHLSADFARNTAAPFSTSLKHLYTRLNGSGVMEFYGGLTANPWQFISGFMMYRCT